MLDLHEILRQIDFEYEYGIRDFEITGGEPSEYDRLRDVCEYIKEKDENSKIAIITNGGLFGSDVWDVFDELLLSYHLSKEPDSFDKSFFPRGTTFKKAEKCVEMAKNRGILLRTNTVLGSFNLENFAKIVDDLLSFEPKIVNFLPVNLFDESKNMVSQIDYNKLRPILKEQIRRIEDTLEDVLVFVRYMPFCDMNGFEKNIVGQLQHIYDWFDWSREIDGPGIIDMSKGNPKDILGYYGKKSLDTVFEQRPLLYEKDRRCLTCRYNIMCDGVERSGGALLGQIVPSVGPMIKNPMQFIGNSTEALYKKIYDKSKVSGVNK